MTREELKGIADIAVDHDITVASDELHADIVFDGWEHVAIASLGPEIADRTISMYGLSKTFGLAGLQIGWPVATNKEIMEGVQRVAGTSSRAPPPSASPSPTQSSHARAARFKPQILFPQPDLLGVID